ncbi:O-antigen ligase [Sphingomonas sp. SORGH_AS 950]|uniref:O-antigen ligase family protein n=1 Tax=Sphingomonas sp. SORGH_AS_0950 TaxID=3041792 RepID=UPI0027800B37|nr:O-antigen ligase family protein [Sphingomonas sp. SORGH_AS_0950]MDQ1159436.1 O-antigen ligase [Sphingomonas sp. SORGH_AS_0950]
MKQHLKHRTTRSWAESGALAGWRHHLLFFMAFIVVILGGGSNRVEVASLIYVRPLLALLLVAMALSVDRAEMADKKWPLALLLAAFALVVVQLVPLPPSLWEKLPGRSLDIAVDRALGGAAPWRPLSLTPDLTLQSAFWFTAPACALLGVAIAERGKPQTMLHIVIGFMVCSAVLGGLQVSQGTDSGLYLYNRTYPGFGVGFLANRNHEAALLACGFPILRLWSLLPARSFAIQRGRLLAMLGGWIIFIPAILLTGSRAGLVLAVVGMACAFVIAPLSDFRKIGGQWGKYLPIAGIGIFLLTVVIVTVAGRSFAFSRLIENNAADDLRITYSSFILKLANQYLPFGSGFGSFDTIFRQAEPDRYLKPTYFNHAHNEYIEILMNGGIVAIFLVVVGVIYWGVTGYRTFFSKSEKGFSIWQARTGWAIILIFLLESVVDYPLRTPLLAFVFAMAAAWMSYGKQRVVGDFGLQSRD